MVDWEKIKKLSKMETESDIREFENVIGLLIQIKDPEVLKKLVDLFYDNCSYIEIMYILLHAIESYPNEMYVISVMQKIPSGLKNYPEWISRLINRILNDDECKFIFCQNLNVVRADDLLTLFDLVESEYSQHHNLFQELRKQIKKEI